MARVAQGHPSPSASITGAERADDRFFAALVEADVAGLEALLADDFVLIDVVAGAVVERAAFLATVGGGQLRFGAIHVLERHTRRYADIAIVVGRTQMEGSLDGVRFEAASRYTHVLLRGEAWQLVNAQGTPIAGAAPQRDEAG